MLNKINPTILNLLVFLTILFLVSLNLHNPNNFLYDNDWGFQLSFADKILAGEHPFIHSLGSVGGPFLYYLSALGQYLSGGRLIAEIALCLLGHSIGFFFLWLLLKKICRGKVLALAALVWAMLLMPKLYKYPITLCPTLFLYALYSYVQDSSKKNLRILALVSAFNLLFRVDFGAHAIFTSLLAILALQIRDKKSDKLFNCSINYLLFLCLPVLPYIIFLLAKGANLFEVVSDVYIALTTAGVGLTIPRPRLDLTAAIFSKHNYFTLLFWTLAVFPLFGILKAVFGTLSRQNKTFLLLLSFHYLHFFLQASHRADFAHLTQLAHVYIPGICLLLLGLNKKYVFVDFLVSGFAVLVLFSGTMLFSHRSPQPFSARLKNIANLKLYSLPRKELREALDKTLHLDAQQAILQTIEYINQHTTKNDKVIVIPYSPHIYYLSERLFGGNFPSYTPGFRTSTEEQNKLIKLIEEQDVNYIVDSPNYAYDKKPERSAKIFMPLVMRYIYENYHVVQQRSDLLILAKNPSA